jgi:hypothetical protein
LDQAYRDISIALDLPGGDDAKTNIFNLVCDWFSNEKNGPWLIVLDNADDAETFFTARPMAGGKHATLYDCLPRSSQGKILITTRDKRVGERLSFGETTIIVPTLNAAQARTMLSSKLHLPLDASSEEVNMLLATLDYLPLAITQAAAYITENVTTVSKYYKALCTNDEEMSELLEKT